MIAAESGLSTKDESETDDNKSEENQVRDILPEEYDILPEDVNTIFDTTGDE